jgi:hypothetical protein
MKYDAIGLGVPAETSAADLFSRLQDISSSRRNLLVRSLGVAGVLGATEFLNGVPAQAPLENNSAIASSGLNIDPTLLQGLRFERRQSRDSAVVFDPDTGLLVGFGNNLFHFDAATRTSRLFTGEHRKEDDDHKSFNFRKLIQGSITEDVQENISQLTFGTTGTLNQTIEDMAGRVITSKTIVQSINDLPDDFLITGATHSNRYTGRFVNVVTSIGSTEGDVLQNKATVDLLTGTLPLGVLTLPGPLFSNPPSSIVDFASEDPDALPLLSIAAGVLDTEFSGLDSLIPTDLQVDFPWGPIVRWVIQKVAAPAVRAVWRVARPVGNAIARAAIWVWNQIKGNAIWDVIKAILDRLIHPCGTAENPQPCPMLIP